MQKSVKSFGGDLPVALDVKTHNGAVTELGIVPLDQHFNMHPKIIPLFIKLNNATTGKCGPLTTETLKNAENVGANKDEAKHIFSMWYKSIILSNGEAKIAPITYDWVSKRSLLTGSIGSENMSTFSDYPRDILSLMTFLKDKNCYFNGEGDIPDTYQKICNRLGVSQEFKGYSWQDALRNVEVYKKLFFLINIKEL